MFWAKIRKISEFLSENFQVWVVAFSIYLNRRVFVMCFFRFRFFFLGRFVFLGIIKINFITKTRLFKYIENLTTKNWKFLDKTSDIFHISAQNIDCGYSLEPPCESGSNEYPQFMFLSRNRKNNVYPCKPQFYNIKVGFKGVKIIYVCFRDAYLARSSCA